MSLTLRTALPVLIQHWRMTLLILSPILIPLCSLMLLLASPSHCAIITQGILVPTTTFIVARYDEQFIIPWFTMALSILHAGWVWFYVHRHIYTTHHRHVVITMSCITMLWYAVTTYQHGVSYVDRVTAVALIGATLVVLASEWWVPSTRHHLHAAESRLLADSPIRHRIHHHYVAHLASLFIEPAEDSVQAPILTPKSVTRYLLDVGASQRTAAAMAKAIDKPVLVLLSGYGAGRAMWLNNFDQLSHYFRIHAVDLLGNGMSKRIPLPRHSVEAVERYFVDSLDQWRQQTGIEKMILCGHSFGGYMAACYALRYPDRVERLILASPVGVPEAPSPDHPAFRRGPPFARPIVALLHAAWRRHYTVSMALKFLGPLGYIITRALVNRRFRNIANWNTHHLGNYIYHLAAGPATGHGALPVILLPGAWAYNPLIKRVHELRCPTFFMYGSYDWMEDWAGRACVDAIRKQGVPSACVIIPEAGHQLFMENASGFNQQLLRFALDDAQAVSTEIDMEQQRQNQPQPRAKQPPQPQAQQPHKTKHT